jgi:mannose-6-phosphate isomerase-like protein (cupin superfamily)
MDEPVLVPPGDGEIIGDSPRRRVEILSDRDELNATTSRFGPQSEGADLHVHRLHSDFFYVLEGEVTVRLGVEDRPVTVPVGMLARVPPLVVHGFRNAGDADMRYLNFHAPGQKFVDYLRALRDRRSFSYDQEDPPADGGRSPDEAAIGEELFVADLPALRIRLLTDIEAIGIAEIRSGPDAPPPPLHVHRHHVESFYVLEGELALTVGGRELRADAGSWVQVPPGVPHTSVLSGAETCVLNLHTPSCGFGAYVRGVQEAQTDAELAAVRAAFDLEPA